MSEIENIIQEYKQKIAQALHSENEALKKQSEQDSIRMVAEAREEAEKILMQARLDASGETKKTIAIIKEIKAELDKETAQLLSDVSKNVARIIADTENKIKTEMEKLDDTIVAAELKFDENLVSTKEPLETNRQTVASKPVIPVEQNNEPQKQATRPKQDNVTAQTSSRNDEGRLFKGVYDLEVSPWASSEKQNKRLQSEWMQEQIQKIPGLRVVKTENYPSFNKTIVRYVIDLSQPVPLLKLFKTTNSVKQVFERGRTLVIELN